MDEMNKDEKINDQKYNLQDKQINVEDIINQNNITQNNIKQSDTNQSDINASNLYESNGMISTEQNGGPKAGSHQNLGQPNGFQQTGMYQSGMQSNQLDTNNTYPNNMNPNNVNQNYRNSNNTYSSNVHPNNTYSNNMDPNNTYPNNIYSNNMDIYNMPYYGEKPKYKIIHDNPEISDFDRLSIHPKNLLSWTFFSLFILAVVVLGVSTILEILVGIAWPEFFASDWYVWVVTFVSIVLFGVPIYYLFIKRIPDSPKGKVKPLKISTFIVIFFICASAMYMTNMFSVMLTFMISIIKGEEVINPLNEAMLGSNFILMMIYAAIIAPIVEEIIFRGLLLNKLRRFGDTPAILLSGVAFGLFHFNLSQFFYAAVLGFIFAYVTIRTNTIKYSILLHVMINFMASVFTPLIAGGNVIAALILSCWVFTAIIIGIVFFILSIKKLRLEKGPTVMKGSSYFLNIGVILYTAISFAMIIISILR